MKRLLILLMFVCLCSSSAFGQSFEWLPGSTYDPSIPTPESVIGHKVGEYYTDYHMVINYIKALEDATGRVKVFKYGQTDERRGLYLVAVSSPENMNRLEEIRSSVARLTDPRKISDAEAQEITQNSPAIGWMNFGTDGNENAASEASMQLAYQLAAGQDELTSSICENVVVIINPCLSPDAYQRYVTWIKSVTVGKHGSPSPDAVSHQREWLMNTNQNHYSIDVNRDAFALSIDVTRQAAKALRHWNPQVWVDNHGTPDTYFFAPPVTPVNENYPPSTLKWLNEIGKNNASYFDKYGWTFMKDETFDMYYPGYFDSYPSFNGAIGTTYETDGGGNKGMVYELTDGSYTTLRDGIHHHFTSNMATLEVLSINRQGILNDFYMFRKSGMEEVASENVKRYILPPGKDAGRLNALVGLMQEHGIEVYRSDADFESRRSQTYFDRASKRRTFPEGSYVIPAAQPQKRLLKVLFEPDPKLEDKFLRIVAEVEKRNEKLGTAVQKERHGFYDVTSWALPLTYGVDAAFTEDDGMDNLSPVTEKPEMKGSVIGGKAGYAYLIGMQTDDGIKAAARLMQKGFKVALAKKPFTNSGIDFMKGTFVIRVQRNKETLHECVNHVAEATGAKIYAVNSAWGDKGISLGSRNVVDLVKPNILVLTNSPVSSTGYGAVWHLLEERFGINFTAVRADMFVRVDLAKYTAIVFPDGSSSGLAQYLGKRGAEKLKQWIGNGGTFVGLKGGAQFAVEHLEDVTDVKVLRKIPSGDEEKEGVPVRIIPGSIFKADINSDYYLGMSYNGSLAVQFRTQNYLSTTKKGVNVVTVQENAHIMGYTWPETEEQIAGKPYMMDIPFGRGHAILFAEDPTFRNYWRGLDRLFLSSILLVSKSGRGMY
ncbi:MAG: hypothetical protein GY841_13510 [FCB group bacterium]|nr:hypothetical protein [FCB group bacterium]